MDAKAGHGIAMDAHEKSGVLLFDQVLIETEPRLDVVRGRRGKPGWYGLCQQGTAWHIDHASFGEHRATVSGWLATWRKDSASHDQCR